MSKEPTGPTLLEPRQHGRPRLVLITGVSGSGKSTAAKALEDLGFHCVDNLPVSLLRTFLAEPFDQISGQGRIAVVADVRAPGLAEAMPQLLKEIDRERVEFLMLFLDAAEDSLVRRFSETRRPHPLGSSEDRPLIESIRRERRMLAGVRAAADLILDTSDWSVHDVRREIFRELGDGATGGGMVVSLVSFGFKHGVPSATDLLFDVRFLPNPFFQPELREKTGLDSAVQAFLESEGVFGELLRRVSDFLLFLLPRYRQENRSYLSVAVGCTGGRHRSVALCELLAGRLADAGETVRLHHRDLDR